MLQFGVLSTFLDMLDRCSYETKQVICHALVQFAQHGIVARPTSILLFMTDLDVGDIQRVLSQDGYLLKLAERAQSRIPSKRDGAIFALVALGNTQGACRLRGWLTQVHDVSESGCDGSHQNSENNPSPCHSAPA